jgi:hypothetical protein
VSLLPQTIYSLVGAGLLNIDRTHADGGTVFSMLL